MKLEKSALYFYALLALPISFVGLPIYMYLPSYYSNNFGIKLAVVGLIMLGIRIFDTITDPLLGMISDRFIKYQNNIMIFSALLLAFAFFLLFNPVLFNKTLNLIIFSFLTYFAFSVLSINHIGYLSHFENKVKISSVREIFTLIGLLLATVVPSVLMLYFTQEQAFYFVSIMLVTIVCLFTILFYFNNRNKIFEQKSVPVRNYGVFKNKDFRQYFLCLLFNGFAIATPSTLVLFYIKDFLQLQKYTGFFLVLYFLSAIMFVPFWNLLARKNSPIKIFKIGMLGSILTFIFCYFLPSEANNFYSYSIICFFSGIFFSVDLIIPPVIGSLLIDKHEYQNSKIFIFSITHFIAKMSAALVSGTLLIFIGSVDVSSYLPILKFCYTFIPCIFKIIAFIFLIASIL